MRRLSVAVMGRVRFRFRVMLRVRVRVRVSIVNSLPVATSVVHTLC